MRSNNLAILLFLFTVTFAFQGCRPASTGENANAAEAVKTEPPFPNQEPEKYQAEIWQTSDRGIEKFFVARDGARWRIDSDYGGAHQVTSMFTDQDYVLSFASKIYAEYPRTHGFDEREGMISEISLGIINGRETAAYEKLSTEAGLTKYKVTAGKDPEAIIYFDEKLGLPVKKEVFKMDGGQRVLDRSVELSGFKTEVDQTAFSLPEGFRKVSVEEMKQALTIGFK